MVNHALRRTRNHWLLLGILLLAIGLRLYRLGAQSLWYDETVSTYLAGQSIPDLIAHTAGDIHPPGYYLMLHVWTRIAGSSDWAAAFPSLFFGVLLVGLAYWLAARLLHPNVGLIAALLVAVSPYNLWYSQEVRMYTLGAVLAMGVLGTVFLVLPVGSEEGQERRSNWPHLLVYAVLAASGLWVLYYFAFFLLAINLMVGVWWVLEWRRGHTSWRWLGGWTLAQFAVLLLYAPWLPVAWRQATSPPVPPWRGFTGLGDLLLQSWSALSLGQSVDPVQWWPALVLFAVLFGAGLLYGVERRARDRTRLESLHQSPAKPMAVPFLAGSLVLPVLLIYLASTITPLYHVRYVFTYSTPFYIILGAGLVWLWHRWRPALWLGLVAIVALASTSIYAYHTGVQYAADDHRAAARYLADRWRPGDAILVDAGYAYTALLRYWNGDPIAWRGRLVDYAGQPPRSGPVVAQAGTVNGDPSLGWGDPASDFYAMGRAETVTSLEQLFAQADRVWVYRIYDTVTDPGGFVRDWLRQHGIQFEDQVFTGESQLRVQGFLTGRNPLAGDGPRRDATLTDGSLTLVSADLGSPTVAVGGSLDMALVWRVESPLTDGAILFAGLFDDAGQRWAQVDERPLGSLYPATAWLPGSIVRTPLRLRVPPGTAPGSLRLEVGWYRFEDGQPIWLPWPEGVWQTLGTVEVVAPQSWEALPLPIVDCPANVTMGAGIRFLGFEMPTREGRAGEALPIDLIWQAVDSKPGIGPAALEIADDAGTILAEAAAAPVGGRVPFTSMDAGQVVRDPRVVQLPLTLEPGVYNLLLGRRDPTGGWLPVRRGLFPLGDAYPLATIRVRQ
jgi:hypothetical protein